MTTTDASVPAMRHLPQVIEMPFQPLGRLQSSGKGGGQDSDPPQRCGGSTI
jgi:hypothetical protein